LLCTGQAQAQPVQQSDDVHCDRGRVPGYAAYLSHSVVSATVPVQSASTTGPSICLRRIQVQKPLSTAPSAASLSPTSPRPMRLRRSGNVQRSVS